MDGCTHWMTKSREGQTGNWCVACGIKVLEVETRACGGCSHFRDRTNTCRKHMMAVFPAMHVCFKIADGSCFETKP